MSLQCSVCGASYEWEMYFFNHMRYAHSMPVQYVQRRICLPKQTTELLEGFYCNRDKSPGLIKIQEIAEILKIKKESVYWWFQNRRKQDKKKQKEMKAGSILSSPQNVECKGSPDRVLDRNIKGRKRKAEEIGEGVGNQYECNKRPVKYSRSK